MKWVRAFLAASALFFGIVLVIGLMQPEEHEATRSLFINQPPEKVWAVLSDFGTHPQWRPELHKTERLKDRNGHEVWRESFKGGEGVEFETTEAVAPTKLVRRIVNVDGPVSGFWRYEISPVPQGSRVTVTEHGSIPSPIFRFIVRFTIGYEAFVEGFLQSLARKFGVPIAIEVPVPSAS